MRVLLVDQDPRTADLCRAAFETEAHVLIVADSHSAADAAALDEFDAILLGTGSDGFEIVARVRDLSDKPLIALSTLRRIDDEVRAWACGVDAYVCPPFSPVDLIDTVRALVGMCSDERRTRREEMLRRTRAIAERVRVDAEQRRLLEGFGALTPVERRVAELVIDGVRVARACAALGIAEGTFWSHKRAIRRKLEVPPGVRLETFLQRTVARD